MKTQKNSFGICLGLTISTCILPVTSVAQFPHSPIITTQTKNNFPAKKVIVRIWHGRTLTTKANEYHAALNEAGIKKILATPANLGVQVLRRTDSKITELTKLDTFSDF